MRGIVIAAVTFVGTVLVGIAAAYLHWLSQYPILVTEGDLNLVFALGVLIGVLAGSVAVGWAALEELGEVEP
mgnify:CR=1 FL=1